jgi:hypothetical protein
MKIKIKLFPNNLNFEFLPSFGFFLIAVRPSRLSKNYGLPCYSYGIPNFLNNLDGQKAKCKMVVRLWNKLFSKK